MDIRPYNKGCYYGHNTIINHINVIMSPVLIVVGLVGYVLVIGLDVIKRGVKSVVHWVSRTTSSIKK